MKPHARMKKADGIRRARMVMRRGLGWMRGFPCADGTWVAFPRRSDAVSCVLGRTEVRRASFAIGRLFREFPRALPAIVDDVERWSLLHRSMLSAIKPSVHQGQALLLSALELHPSYSPKVRGAVRRGLAKNPELESVIDAFTWYCWLEPQTLGSAMAWLEHHAKAARGIVRNYGTRDGGILLVRLWELHCQHGSKRIGPVRELLGDSMLRIVPTCGGYGWAQAASSALGAAARADIPERPVSRLAPELEAWVHWLVTRDPRTARRSLELFALLRDGVDFAAWSQWWLTIERIAKEGYRLQYGQGKRGAVKGEVQAFVHKLRDQGAHTPACVSPLQLFRLLRDEAEVPTDHQARQIRRALEALPSTLGDAPVRLAFALQWNCMRKNTSDREQKRFTLQISEFASLVAEHSDHERLLAPWKDLWRRPRLEPVGRAASFRVYVADAEVLSLLPKNEQIREFYAAVGLLQTEPGFVSIDDEAVEELIDLVLVTGDAVRSVIALSEMKEAGLIEEYVSQELLSIAARICASDIGAFASVVGMLVKLDARQSAETIGKRLLWHWQNISEETLLRCVCDGHLPSLASSVLSCEMIRSAGGAAPRPLGEVPGRAPSWIRRYPKELRPALRTLASLDRNARDTARRILKKDIPDPSDLAAQIAELDARIAQGGATARLVARRAKLESWRTSPQLPKPGRLANLADKLEAAGYAALVSNWALDVQHALAEHLPGLLGTTEVPAWAKDDKVLELLSATYSLSVPMRAVATQLLQARSGSGPWDLRTEPANKRFLRKMAKRGIKMAPFIDAAPVLRRVREGEPLHFTLERDPLEVFAMGQHFRTCLSPGSFNYFSVFANAADVNKQVLYGRKADGSVVARCLLALTSEGGLVAFHPYCHNRKIGFEAIVQDYVHSLAAEMGTAVVSGGEVSRLVAPEWYDDGAQDISEQFSLLRSEKVAEALRTAPLEEAVGIAEEALAPLSLSELTLPVVLGLDVMRERGELVKAFAPALLRAETLAPEHALRAMELLIAADDPEAASRFATRMVAFALAEHSSGMAHNVERVALALAECAPSKALYVLTKTRTRPHRSWKTEDDGARLYPAALACFALGRPAQARKLLGQALAQPCCKLHKGLCKELLERLP